MDKLPLYRSHKLVRAAPVIWVGGDVGGKTKVMLAVAGEPLDRMEIEVLSEVFARRRPAPRDYIVWYPPSAEQPYGYVSWSPCGVFEAGYVMEAE